MLVEATTDNSPASFARRQLLESDVETLPVTLDEALTNILENARCLARPRSPCHGVVEVVAEGNTITLDHLTVGNNIPASKIEVLVPNHPL